MEIITLKYNVMKKALTTLEKGLEKLQHIDSDALEDYAFGRDSVIKRFEYCIDTFWKFLKVYNENYC